MNKKKVFIYSNITEKSKRIEKDLDIYGCRPLAKAL